MCPRQNLEQFDKIRCVIIIIELCDNYRVNFNLTCVKEAIKYGVERTNDEFLANQCELVVEIAKFGDVG